MTEQNGRWSGCNVGVCYALFSVLVEPCLSVRPDGAGPALGRGLSGSAAWKWTRKVLMPGKREGSLLGLYVTAVLLLSDFFRNLFFFFFFSAVLSLLNARDIVSNLAPESVGAYFSPQTARLPGVGARPALLCWCLTARIMVPRRWLCRGCGRRDTADTARHPGAFLPPYLAGTFGYLRIPSAGYLAGGLAWPVTANKQAPARPFSCPVYCARAAPSAGLRQPKAAKGSRHGGVGPLGQVENTRPAPPPEHRRDGQPPPAITLIA